MHFFIKILDDQSEERKTLLRNYYSTYKKAYPTDSGIDLIIPENYLIKGGATQMIHLGIACALDRKIPCGYFLCARSSISKTSTASPHAFLFVRTRRAERTD